MKAFMAIIAMFATFHAHAMQISKELKLQNLTSGGIKESILDGRLRLPATVAVTYRGADSKVLRLTGEDKDVKAAEKAIAAIDVRPRMVTITFELKAGDKTIAKPTLHSVVGSRGQISEDSLKGDIRSFSADFAARESADGLVLQASLSFNNVGFVLPSGVQSGDIISFIAEKSACYLRWSRAGKTLGEYPVPEEVKQLRNSRVTVSIGSVSEP